MKNLAESARAILREYVDNVHNGVKSRAAKALNLSPMTLNQWLDGKRVPNLENLSPVFEKLNITFAVPQADASRDVCFVNAKVVPAGEHVLPPQSEDYIAAPLVGEVGAGPGYVAQDDIESWFLVYKHVPAIMHRKDLIAVEIGQHSTSMTPLLNPGDIVLVDREDHSVEHPGHIMLVRDPDGAGMIKRVALNKDGDDWIVQFYSDNAAKNPPMIYKLAEDFDGDITKAVVGRVIWAWTDVRGK